MKPEEETNVEVVEKEIEEKVEDDEKTKQITVLVDEKEEKRNQKKEWLKVHSKNLLIICFLLLLIFYMMNLLENTTRIKGVNQAVEEITAIPIHERTPQKEFEMIGKILSSLFQLNEVFTYSLVLLFACYFLLRAITGNSKRSFVILFILEIIFETINYMVKYLRGSGVTISDIYNVRTALNVMSGIEVEFSICFFLGVLLFILGIVCLLKIKIKENKLRLWQKMAMVLFSLWILVSITKSDYIDGISIWDINEVYEERGSFLTIAIMARNMEVKKPENYKVSDVEKILAEYEAEENTSLEDAPNIIVIMNESFADLYQEREVGNRDPIPYTRNLMQSEGVISGAMYSSEQGGGTANVEYEFLTQNTTAFLPVGSTPYQQYVRANRDNLARTMKNLGYKTSAIHTWYRSGYSRQKIYTLFGFDKILFYEDIPDLVIGYNDKHPTDKSTYDQIIKLLEKKEEKEKIFNFTITMQNHISYIAEDETQEKYSDDSETNIYLQLTHNSDEALEYLIHYLENYDEKIILMLFGDHPPKIQALEIDYENIEEYRVPFFIWANYEIEEEKDVRISANYLQSYLMKVAGLPKTSYQLYMEDMRKTFPVITRKFYQTQAGESYVITDDTSSDYDKIREYQKVIVRPAKGK